MPPGEADTGECWSSAFFLLLLADVNDTGEDCFAGIGEIQKHFSLV
jgi:hypothetical protein